MPRTTAERGRRMTLAQGEVRYSGPATPGRSAHRARYEREARDRWLLMRLLGAARSTPRLADRLLAERGSLGSVLALSDERLKQLGADPNSIAMFRLLRETIAAVLEPPPDLRARLETPDQLIPVLRAEMACLDVEQVRAVFLDAGFRIIRIEVMATGSVWSAPVYPRELARRSLELAASGLILVHNHPSGDPTPSPEDEAISRNVAAALATVEVRLIDHIVIARGGWASAMPRARAGHGRRAEAISTVGISNARPCADRSARD